PASGCFEEQFSFTHYPKKTKPLALMKALQGQQCPQITVHDIDEKGTVMGTLGPVVGEVTSSTARVMLETSVPVELTCTLTRVSQCLVGEDQEEAIVQQVKQVSEPHQPVVFSFSALAPSTRYTVAFEPLSNSNNFGASFRTRPMRTFAFKMAAVWGEGEPYGYLEGSSYASMEPFSLLQHAHHWHNPINMSAALENATTKQ
ncbi:unnamed protein product, partial [Chrysoparadoxa australica]